MGLDALEGVPPPKRYGSWRTEIEKIYFVRNLFFGAPPRALSPDGFDERKMVYSQLLNFDLNRLEFSGLELSGLDLSGLDLSGFDLEGIEFSGVEDSGLELWDSTSAESSSAQSI